MTRLLLALHAAGERGILVSALLARIPTSKASLYRDLELIRSVGWRVTTTRHNDLEGVPVSYALAGWQRLPKLDK